jgi:hypothetical protein
MRVLLPWARKEIVVVAGFSGFLTKMPIVCALLAQRIGGSGTILLGLKTANRAFLTGFLQIASLGLRSMAWPLQWPVAVHFMLNIWSLQVQWLGVCLQ